MEVSASLPCTVETDYSPGRAAEDRDLHLRRTVERFVNDWNDFKASSPGQILIKKLEKAREKVSLSRALV